MQLKSILSLLTLICGVSSVNAQMLRSKPATEQRVSSRLASDLVNVQILFEHKNMPFKMELWEVPPELYLDLSMSSHASISKGVPFVKPISNEFRVRRGETTYFGMVIKNDSNEPYYFYSSYHQMRPEEAALGYIVNCLCVNRIFVIPPKSYWYRVGSIVLGSTFIGETVAIKHDIFGMTSEQFQKKKLQSLVEK
ncbi:MAG: hypothetical protein ACLGGX_05035 [Bdellovibrionia bacterium]